MPGHTIADYPRITLPLAGDELIAAFQNGMQVAMPLALVGRPAAAPAASPAPYRYGGFAVTDILAGEILMEHHVVLGHALALNLGGRGASAGTLPTTPWALSLELNGTPIGALTIDPTGSVAGSTTSGSAVAIKAGDVLTAIAPELPDPAIGRVRFTFAGSVS